MNLKVRNLRAGQALEFCARIPSGSLLLEARYPAGEEDAERDLLVRRVDGKGRLGKWTRLPLGQRLANPHPSCLVDEVRLEGCRGGDMVQFSMESAPTSVRLRARRQVGGRIRQLRAR